MPVFIVGMPRSGTTLAESRSSPPTRPPSAPAAVYFYSPDHGGEHPAVHLAHFTGFLQADAYSGFAALYEPRKAGPGLPMMPAITEVACWAHCRRSIFDVAINQVDRRQSGARADRSVLRH